MVKEAINYSESSQPFEQSLPRSAAHVWGLALGLPAVHLQYMVPADIAIWHALLPWLHSAARQHGEIRWLASVIGASFWGCWCVYGQLGMG